MDFVSLPKPIWKVYKNESYQVNRRNLFLERKFTYEIE